MNILFLSSGDHVPSARFRILPYLSFFRADGHRCTLASSFPQKYDYFPWMGFRPSQLLKRSVRWWHWLKACLSRYDLVFIDREIFDDGTTAMEERFRGTCKRLVLDLDDAVFLRQPEKFNRLLPMADLVVCGNRFLQEKVEPLNPATLHIPTCVSMDDYALREPSDGSARPVAGWMGTTGNLQYLKVAAEALRSVALELDFELRVVVPDVQPLEQIDLTGVNVVHEPWQPKNEVAQLQQMDVGLMPLFPDQEWDVYKCGLKLIQYLAVGVPGIASPVGVNSEILAGNRNGLCAESTDEWSSALRSMLSDRAKSHAMGVSGRQTVQERYSVQANYPILRDALLRLCAK